MRFKSSGKTGFINLQLSFGRHFFGELDWKAVGIVEMKDRLSINNLSLLQGLGELIELFLSFVQCLGELLFFRIECRADLVFFWRSFGYADAYVAITSLLTNEHNPCSAFSPN